MAGDRPLNRLHCKNRVCIIVLAALAATAALFYLLRAPAPPAQAPRPASPPPVSSLRPAVSSPQPPVPRDAALAPLLDRHARLTDRVKPDVNSGIPKVVHPEDYALLVAVLTDPTDDDTARNEVANLLQRSKFPGLADALCKVLDDPAEKPRFRAYATQHLGLLLAPQQPETGNRKPETSVVSAKLRACLSDRDVPVRREALLALVRQRDPKAIETAVAWLQPETTNQKPETVVVDLAIRCVHELNLREHIPAIRKYARDSNDVVRIAAIVALSQWADEESRPAFEDAAQSKTVRLQRAGKAALERLDTGKTQPPTPPTPPLKAAQE